MHVITQRHALQWAHLLTAGKPGKPTHSALSPKDSNRSMQKGISKWCNGEDCTIQKESSRDGGEES